MASSISPFFRDKSPIVLIFGSDWVATAILWAELIKPYLLEPFPIEEPTQIYDLDFQSSDRLIFWGQKHDST